MKKLGFTLAEVLIVIMIIGVIAAITLPGLLTNIREAQIGPKLAKARSIFEQANVTLLDDNSIDLITDGFNNTNNYITELRNFLKGDANGATYTTDDNMRYTIAINGAPANQNIPGYQQTIGTVQIDIDGPLGPNTLGRDRFNFLFRNDGSLEPNDVDSIYIFTHNLKVRPH